MDTVVDTVDVGRWTLSIERPVNPEALIDESAFARDEFLPYWAELWPSGVGLARHVSRLDLVGLRVLELGCGLALPSITASLAGARVLATDWSDTALDLVTANAMRNGTVVTTAQVDWRAPHALAGERFDVVLAADVLYEARNVEPLADLLASAVGRGALALVGDPGRRHAASFLGLARGDARWSIETLPSRDIPHGGIHCLWRDRHTTGTRP